MTKTNLQSFMLEDDQIHQLISTLESGGLILYPTDTIWGIGCDATNPNAIEDIYRLKKRDRSKPFVLLVDSIDMLKQYVHQVHPRLETLLHYHTRPLTIVYDQAKNLPPIAYSKDGTVAIRVVQDDFCRMMIAAYRRPLVASSANISNESPPGNFGEISSAVIENVDYVIKRRQHEKSIGTPSVMVKIDPKIRRIGLFENVIPDP